MFEYIRGTLTNASPLNAVVEAGGLGYKLFIPTSDYSGLPEPGCEVKLYLSQVIRENLQALYAFTEPGNRDLFESLLSVSGIGPKMALGLIGSLESGELHRAIQSKDIAVLCRVPGVGKRTAERLVIELRDKLPAFAMRDPDLPLAEAQDPASQCSRDALSALINLGYKQSAAQAALRKAAADFDEEPDLGSLITRALSHT